jgi:ribosomal protein L11 methyltransferase
LPRVKVKYVELAFAVEPEAAEQDLVALIECGAAGVEERDETTTFDKAPPGRALLVVWVDPADVEPFLARARAAGVACGDVRRRDRDEDEWRDAWKKHFAPRRVGEFVIVPSWERYAPSAGDVVLDLDPGRAFGTGGHASTRLCLELLADVSGAARVLDVGCGSGILAIACARKWPGARVVGVDVDADSIDVSRENAARNHVEAAAAFSTTPVQDLDEQFDLVLANILPDVLIPLAPEIAARVDRGGTLLLSGILIEHAADVKRAYLDCGLRFAAARDEEGWRALRFLR